MINLKHLLTVCDVFSKFKVHYVDWNQSVFSFLMLQNVLMAKLWILALCCH